MKLEKAKKVVTLDTGITRHKRALNYLSELKETNQIPLSKKKKAIINELYRLVEERSKRIKIITGIQIFCYLAIYFSFISFLLQDLFFFSSLSLIIKTIVGIFGTSILVIGIVICAHFKGLYYEDISLLSAQVISLYSTVDYTVRPKDAKNTYQEFLDYYHKKLKIED